MEGSIQRGINAKEVLSVISDSIILIDKSGLCIDVIINNNNLWFINQKLVGQNIIKLLPGELREEAKETINKLKVKEEQLNYTYKKESKSNKVYYVKVIMHNLEDFIVCQCIDETNTTIKYLELEKKYLKLKEREEKQRKRFKEFYEILKAASEKHKLNIKIKDPSNKFKTIYDSSNLKPRTSYLKVLKEKLDDVEIHKYHKEIQYIEKETHCGKRTKVYLIQKFPILLNSAYPLIVHLKRDITEEEKGKTNLIKAKEEAIQSNKLKSNFLANISHEIKTPLNAIIGFARIIAETNKEKERKEYYQIIYDNSERLLKLINEILDISKIESGILDFSIAEVNLYELCNEILAIYIIRCKKNVNLIFEQSPSHLKIHSDKSRIFQVISNLIENSIKFTTKGTIRFGYFEKKEEVCFYIKDTGCGIDKKMLPHIFERFIKSKSYSDGNGLGLSICKTIIEHLGGRIESKSKENTGTEFTFYLPIESVSRK